MSIKDINTAGQLGGLEYCMGRLETLLAELEQARKASVNIPYGLEHIIISAEAAMHTTAEEIASVIKANS